MQVKEQLKKTKLYKMFSQLTWKRYILKRIRNVQSKGLYSMSRLMKNIDPYNVRLFVDFGTLLGIVRDNKIIDWDDDIDFGIIINDDFNWNHLEKIMLSLGFKKKHEFEYKDEITEQNYEKDFISIDFFRHYEYTNQSITYVYTKDKSKEYACENLWDVMEFKTPAIKKISLAHLNEFEIPVPSNAEEYLESVYGKNWRIPDPNWKTGDGPATTKLGGEYAKATFFED